MEKSPLVRSIAFRPNLPKNFIPLKHPGGSGPRIWLQIADRFMSEAPGCQDIGKVWFEGYAMGAHGRVFDIAESTFAMKAAFLEAGVEVNLISPTAVKKRFTGSGKAGKPEMIREFNRIAGYNLALVMGFKDDYSGSPVSDVVDSYAVLKSSMEEGKVA